METSQLNEIQFDMLRYSDSTGLVPYTGTPVGKCGDSSDEGPGSSVESNDKGWFPCLHIVVSGLLQDRRYLLALDFSEMFIDANKRFQHFTEPYYMPRPNHLEGRDWMERVLYFNLTSIVNGGLQENGMTLAPDCEYVPTLRIMGSGNGGALSSSPAICFALKNSELLAVSLKSEVLITMGNSAREFLLVRRYEMKRCGVPHAPAAYPPKGPQCKSDAKPTKNQRRHYRDPVQSSHPRPTPGIWTSASQDQAANEADNERPAVVDPGRFCRHLHARRTTDSFSVPR
ncbi:hypothetical protein HPB47_027364 [Ixodes persulcatus]|uniref:Uncharacterized protein n=1 Tax=Ixodes persulcatus TaxID=34615 RepID=A0AC60PXP7_IXOPE|nr:hypothetical protein HPB47_027364 [Ixodes persulcatus]